MILATGISSWNEMQSLRQVTPNTGCGMPFEKVVWNLSGNLVCK